MKEILYESTRGGERNITASQAVLTGLAKDGGLYVPMTMPALPEDFFERSIALHFFHRAGSVIRQKPFAQNLAGLYDAYRRPKVAAQAVKVGFARKAAGE